MSRTVDYIIIDPTAGFEVPKNVDCTVRDLKGTASGLVGCSDGEVLAVMHMTASRFIDAIMREELLPRMLCLRERSGWAYLVISGILRPGRDGLTIRNEQPTQLAWHTVQGALTSVQEAGVVVLNVADKEAVWGQIETTSRRSRAAMRVKPYRDALFLDPTSDMLVSLPGIGLERAKDLVAECGTAAIALVTLTDPAYDLPKGIGEKTRTAVRKALGLDARVTLALIGTTETLDDAMSDVSRITALLAHYWPNKNASLNEQADAAQWLTDVLRDLAQLDPQAARELFNPSWSTNGVAHVRESSINRTAA